MSFFSPQDNKSDVKAIMARFQAGGGSTDETSSAPPGRIKQPLHPTLSSGPPLQKKPVLESLSGSAVNTPPKPSFLKNTVSTKSDTEVQEPNKAKALASRFANIQDDSNTNSKPFTVNKQQTPLKSPLSQAPEVKSLAQKPPFNKPPLTSTLSESKPAFPKPSPAISNKPSWVKDENNAAPNSSPAPLKLPGVQQKPIGGIVKLRQQAEEQAGGNKDNVIKPSSLANSKPTSNFRTAQNLFNKEEKTEQTESGGTSKPSLTATNSISPPKPPASKKPSFKKPVKPSPLASGGVNGNDSSGPKRNPLPNSLALGPPPAKPNRPPKVNLENIKRGPEASDEGKLDLSVQLQSHTIILVSGMLTFCHTYIQGNPEGKWLGRAQDGSIGYVKTTSVEIDFNSLKNQGASLQQAYDPEVYDDIDVVDNRYGIVTVYDESLMWSQHSFTDTDIDYTFENATIDEEIYDDVDSQNAPIPPPISSIPPGKIKSKVEEMDPKKQKKFEKEEKEFRKKFKYEGEIQVLYQVNVIHNLTNKKWSGKELPVKAGEALDVIAKAVDNKLICRNEDGNTDVFVFVYSDGDIYDDIGDGTF
uniref:FYN binding protein b n=1 Tax=Neolamprologus brichardi TaxID=32507 RepID=A0A3Q4N6H5_NEOBR